MSDEEDLKWWAEVQKVRDDELVARYRHFEQLALRMLVGEIKPGQSGQYDRQEVRHLAEMLLLLDIARGHDPWRWRSRYVGNY